MILVYITCRDKIEARKIAMHLLKERLIACANIFPIESMYWWKGAIEKGKETVLIGKTQEKHYAHIKKSVKQMHSYKTICVMKINADANDEFSRWITNETKT